MEILGKILGNSARVRIMRLFLQSEGKAFSNKDIAIRTRTSAGSVRKELNLLSSVGMIRKLSSGWVIDTSFNYISQFEELLVNAKSVSKKYIYDIFKKTGKLKFLAYAGVFIQNKDSRVDLLIVGDKISAKKVEEGIRRLEAETGTELTYVVFETQEFVYRLNMYDKLARDILDFPHQVITESKELSTLTTKRA
ncbi:MAG: hypothetical protein K9L98_00705 [Candidatus Pacebacteria bacterium]|nr:hypothetical protein [Candidatus Paceibacterota bacterium]MCF7862519.1 hypothetical protein [Candidatus Paceibacterota bacterium]